MSLRTKLLIQVYLHLNSSRIIYKEVTQIHLAVGSTIQRKGKEETSKIGFYCISYQKKQLRDCGLEELLQKNPFHNARQANEIFLSFFLARVQSESIHWRQELVHATVNPIKHDRREGSHRFIAHIPFPKHHCRLLIEARG